jgi:hypothetical protein
MPTMQQPPFLHVSSWQHGSPAAPHFEEQTDPPSSS